MERNHLQAGKRILMTLWGEKKATGNKQALQDIPRYCLVANTVMRRETPKVTSGPEEMRDPLQCGLAETSPPVG